MTLAELELPVSVEWGRQHALVFSVDLAQRLAEVQAEYGDPRHRPNAVPLTDGRFMLAGDVLAECLPGGLVYGGFSQLDAGRFDEIEVLPLAEALQLIPAE